LPSLLLLLLPAKATVKGPDLDFPLPHLPLTDLHFPRGCALCGVHYPLEMDVTNSFQSVVFTPHYKSCVHIKASWLWVEWNVKLKQWQKSFKSSYPEDFACMNMRQKSWHCGTPNTQTNNFVEVILRNNSQKQFPDSFQSYNEYYLTIKYH
jgi:hypothetical protein